MSYHLSPFQKRPPIIKRVVQTIKRYGMFTPNEKVLVGVSGGPDSTALLHMLHGLAPDFGFNLAVGHLNHGLRPIDAEKDQAFVKHMAEALNLPFYWQRATIESELGSIEERARELRYAFFNDVMNHHGLTKIALGHHKNDNAEAVLMHLLRGSGIRGLAGIPPTRDGRVVRPLIQLSRSEILSYLYKNHISFVEDTTNDDQAYERNRIRHHLIPLLESAYNANIVETLHRTADLCWEEETWLQHLLRQLLRDLVARSDKARLELHLHMLAEKPLALQRRLIRGAIQQWHGTLRRMRAVHIDAVIGLLPNAAKGKKISLPFDIVATRNVTHLCFYHGDRSVLQRKAERFEYCYWVPSMDHLPITIDVPEADCRLLFKSMDAPGPPDELSLGDEDWAWFDLDELIFPISIRNIKPGDRINPYGMQGSQKIKKLFIDRKIPSNQRPRIPMLTSQENILWVIGLRRGNQAVVTRNTRRVLGAQVVWSP